MVHTGSSVRIIYLLLCGGIVQQGLAFLTDSEFTDCNGFFYENKPPSGMIHSETTAYICQLFANQVRYATMYNTGFRIPLFAAYTLDTTCKTPRPKIDFWYIEPQLSGYPENAMSHLNHKTPEEEFQDAQLKEYQAVNLDYDAKTTGLDLGHMNPNNFQCKEGAEATFTLTNAVPQAHDLNNGPWGVAETRLKKDMTKVCPASQKYVVTGAVPGNERMSGRVAIPVLMWTAACCAKPKAGKMYSSAYYAYNTNEAKVQQIQLHQLQDMLKANFKELYADGFEIFANGCQDEVSNDLWYNGPNHYYGHTDWLYKLLGYHYKYGYKKKTIPVLNDSPKDV